MTYKKSQKELELMLRDVEIISKKPIDAFRYATLRDRDECPIGNTYWIRLGSRCIRLNNIHYVSECSYNVIELYISDNKNGDKHFNTNERYYSIINDQYEFDYSPLAERLRSKLFKLSNKIYRSIHRR